MNLSIKSGSNGLHGTAYYYNRNEALAVQSQLQATKPELRNQQFDICRWTHLEDHLFFFTTYEDQRFLIGVGQPSTEPSAAYQTQARASFQPTVFPSAKRLSTC